MKSSAQVTYLTKNLYITDDESLIIDYLVDNKEMPVNFEVNHVIGFYVKADFHLVIYFSQLDDRGFQMYVVEDFSKNIEELALLRDLFFQMIKDGKSNDLFKKAHYRIDTILHMAKTLRAAIHKDASDYDKD